VHPTRTEATGSKVYLVSIIPIPNFAVWQAELEGATRVLARLGVSRHWVYRGADGGDEVMTVFELPSLDHAARLLRSTEVDIPAWMDRIGLEVYPSFFVGEQTEAYVYPEPARGPRSG
jgi:hypothetical protein